MNLITVTPITHSVLKEELSYYSDLDIPKNAIVSVRIRNKQTPALVLHKEPIKKVKTKIRTSKYELKKIDSVLVNRFYSKDVLRSAKDTAEFYAVSLGSVLKSITPVSILEDLPKISLKDKKLTSEYKPESLVLQVSLKERLIFYKQNIRGSLARGKTIVICVPTKREVEFFSNYLQKGVEHLTFSAHGKMSDKHLKEFWKNVSKQKTKLVICTGLFLSAPFGNVDEIIIENEASETYYSNKRPYFNIMFVARLLAKKSGAKLISADSVLSTGTINEYRKEKAGEVLPLQKKYRKGARVTVIDMTAVKEKEGKNPTFPFFSLEALKAISESVNKTFVYTTRKGLSPTTTCSDCGFTFFCHECNAPLVLHGNSKTNVFICHTCGETQDAIDKCPQCRSWRLTQLGIGSQKVSKMLEKIFPKKTVIRIDSDNADTLKKENQLWMEFQETKDGILVGTELAFNNLRLSNEKIDTVVVVSMDTLLTYPNYNASEKAFRIMVEMSLFAKVNFLIQTRVPQQLLLYYIKNKDISGFCDNELYIREKLFYPPFSVPVTVTFYGDFSKILEKENSLREMFALFEPIFYKSISEKRRGQIVRKMLIRLSASDWPNQKLTKYLKSLTPEYKVAVHPPVII